MKDEAGRDWLSFRRAAFSPSYSARFGPIAVPAVCGVGHFFFQHRPRGKFTAPTPCTLSDRNREGVPAIIEAFDSSYEVFFFLYPVAARPEAFSAAVC